VQYTKTVFLRGIHKRNPQKINKEVFENWWISGTEMPEVTFHEGSLKNCFYQGS
jgi:hypothetical protein